MRLKLTLLIFISIISLFFGKLALAQTTDTSSLDKLKSELTKIQGDSKYMGALLFNAFGTNTHPDFKDFILTDSQISTVCTTNCGKIGINSANFYSQADGFYQRARSLGMQYTLEIAQSSNNTESVITGLINANKYGEIPIIRIGVGTDNGNSDDGGFKDPQAYVSFLRKISSDHRINFDVYAIAGSNEPETERWISPNCGETEYVCIGASLARYMNTVIAGAGGLPHIKLLSPAFNMTDTASVPIVKAMIGNAARFNAVVAIAGNAYNSDKTITTWVDDFLSQAGLTGNKVLLTETGNLDGTSAGTPTKNDFDPEDVPCKDDRYYDGGEYHSLRPYPASPCDKKLHDTALMCSNNLIVKKEYRVRKDQGVCNGNICSYDFKDETVSIGISLPDAELPIIGNTELVGNATDRKNPRSSFLTDEQKVNEYVSWYLNGVVGIAEEEPVHLGNESDISRLINFSGPLKKLLPQRVETQARIDTITDADNSKGYNAEIRHNQTTNCFIGNILPVPCWFDSATALKEFSKYFQGFSVFYSNITDFMLTNNRNSIDTTSGKYKYFQAPPVEEAFTDFKTYWKKYLEWRGNTCSFSLPIGGFYFCGSLTGNPNFSAAFFPYVPFSSTEDRMGEIITDQTDKTGHLQKTFQITPDQGNGGEVNDVTFKPDNDKHPLYFAHTQEVAELAKILQNTYAPKSSGTPYDWEAELRNAIKSQDEKSNNTGAWEEARGCVPAEVRTNPGDNLYGNLPKDSGQKITGTLTYDTKFICEFKPEVNQEEFQACIESDDYKNGKKTEQECKDESTHADLCKKDIFISLGIYTKSPNLYEIAQRLVGGCDPTKPETCTERGGGMSVVKRFFPKPGPSAPLEQIEDIPGSTIVNYESAGNETRGGDPGKSEANLLFPGLGGLQEYFLHGIQQALRPQGFGPGSSLAGAPEAAPVDITQCKPEWGGIKISEFPSAIQTVFNAASRKYNIPTCVLSGIASVEGSRMKLLTESEALAITRAWINSPEEEISQDLMNKIHCSANSAGAGGPMQMTPGAFNPYKNASGSPNPSVCNARDAIFATAAFLVQGRLPAYGYPAGSPWSEPGKFCAAAQTFYGSCRLDRPTCNNLGTNYCDFLLDYCRADINLPSNKCSEYFPTDPR